MRKSLLLLTFAAISLSLFAQKNPAKLEKKEMKPMVELKNGQDSASYAYGIVLAGSVKRQLSSDLNRELLIQSLSAALRGDSMPFSPENATKIFGEYNRTMLAKAAEKSKVEGQRFMDENKKRKEVTTTASGLQYETLKKGAGTVSPKATDKVEVHYHGTLIDGTVFDSSVDRGQPASFGLNQVIKGWTEGLQYMHEGDKFKFVIPSALAYGDKGAGGKIKPGSTLIFEVELLKIIGNEPAPANH
jgi:FKBP-type peptidyl-prolyl cis-trans isomerase